MRHLRALGAVAALATVRLWADNNPPPSQPANSVSPPYAGAGLNAPFPDSIYGADHAGSGISLAYAYTSPFGYTDHSRGIITYSCAPFTPRNSEGVYGMDVWLEQQDSSGEWGPASLQGGVPDQGATYQPVNTPNPGPSPRYAFTWTFNETPLPPNTLFRVFIYVYLYNQGGGNQGNFYVASSVGTVNTGAANDAPRLAWTASSGSTNPTQVSAGQSYTISADAQDDNGNLVAVSINKNGQAFADAGGGNGFSGNSQNPTIDPPGVITYTAWATDSDGAQSPTLTWTVTVVANPPPPPPGPSNQPPVGSNNATLVFGQWFTPTFSGGAGSGGWQFVLAGFTNWDGGTTANAGTWMPGGSWAAAWLPPAVGAYSFWVIRDGDASYNPSSAAGPYTLTVSPAPAGFSAAPIFFTYNGSAQGPSVSPSPANAPFQITGTAVATGAGPYSFTVTATGNYGGSTTVNWIIDPAGQPPVVISPVNSTITAGQSITFTATGGSSPSDYTWSGAASGTGATNTVPFDTAGNYSVTVARPGDFNYLSSNTAVATITVTAPSSPPSESPPTATLSASPAEGMAPLTTTLVWTTAQATSVSVSGAGVASTALSGTQAVTLSNPGAYPYVLSASGPGGQVTRTATVVVNPPQAPAQYTLTTIALGNGSVTPGGTYPANAVLSVTATPGASATFTGWTGSLTSPSNLLGVTMTGDLTLYANFSSLQAQTITFAPPPTLPFPGPSVTLSATASSGLPVSLTLVSGPGTLSGGQLILSGTGTLVIQAIQNGNALWLPALPVTAVINAPTSSAIARIRFNATGHDVHVNGTKSNSGTSILWTDPDGLLLSPWPPFANPQTIVPATGNVSLPTPPVAPVQLH